MKKIINDPQAFVDEIIEGILLAHPESIRSVHADNRSLVRTSAGKDGKVGIVTGGGSGHLPLFLGYVGEGLASGVAVGNVFASPSVDQIARATKAADSGKGVLYLYGNYGGDVLNFDAAATKVAPDGIATSTVLGNDDILSAPQDRKDTRRGVAGLFFAYKTAGAAADRGDDLQEVTRIAQKTCDNMRTMGVGLSPTILPAAGEPTFTLPDGEMEIGIGIHGEPGPFRGPIESADSITDRFMTEIAKEIDFSVHKRVAVLVNGLGATPLEELYLIYRKVHTTLAAQDVTIVDNYIGEYATSLEMMGASLTVLIVDDELEQLLDAPAESPFFSKGTITDRSERPTFDKHHGVANHDQAGQKDANSYSNGKKDLSSTEVTATLADDPSAARRTGQPSHLREVIAHLATALPSYSEELRDLDAALGDGDLGVTVASGAAKVAEVLEDIPEDIHPEDLISLVGTAFSLGNPSTFATLMGGGIELAASSFADGTVDPADLLGFVSMLLENIQSRGKAKEGDKTVVDVLLTIKSSLEQSSKQEFQSAHQLVDECIKSVEVTVGQQQTLLSRRGRASWVGERSIGKKDPGSVAVLRTLEEIKEALKRTE